MAATQFHSKGAEEAAQMIIEAFQDPDSLPAKLAPVVLASGGRHSGRYSWRNQLLVALHGYSDAAGYKQWLNDYGRQVRKGEHGFFILRPVKRSFNVEEPDPAQPGRVITRRVTYISGFADVRVFGQEQTEIVDAAKWEAFQGKAAEAQRKIEANPLYHVATRWGLKVQANGHLAAHGILGCYMPSRGEIELAVENLSTWAHELIHFVDDKLGNMTARYGQQPDNEIVAELGGAVLLAAMGLTGDADLGGCWSYVCSYAEGGDAIKACGILLGRTLDAVSCVLEALEDESAAPPWAEASAA